MSRELRLPESERLPLWDYVVRAIEKYGNDLPGHWVKQEANPKEVHALVQSIDFSKPWDPKRAIDFVVEGFWKYQIHTAHPRYFGLFDPAPTTMGIMGETLAAGFNSQLAVWMTNPLAVEIENYLYQVFAERFGYSGAASGGAFTAGASLVTFSKTLRFFIFFPNI